MNYFKHVKYVSLDNNESKRMISKQCTCKWTGVRPFCSFIRKTDGGECAKGDLQHILNSCVKSDFEPAPNHRCEPSIPATSSQTFQISGCTSGISR